jgi:hypothetical protein
MDILWLHCDKYSSGWDEGTYGAICVDMHQSASLVVGQLGEGDAKLGGSDGQAALAPAVLQPTTPCIAVRSC